VHVGIVGEVQPVDLRDHTGEGDTAAAVVAHVLEDAPEALGQLVVAEALAGLGAGELGPEPAPTDLGSASAASGAGTWATLDSVDYRIAP